MFYYIWWLSCPYLPFFLCNMRVFCQIMTYGKQNMEGELLWKKLRKLLTALGTYLILLGNFRSQTLHKEHSNAHRFCILRKKLLFSVTITKLTIIAYYEHWRRVINFYIGVERYNTLLPVILEFRCLLCVFFLKYSVIVVFWKWYHTLLKSVRCTNCFCIPNSSFLHQYT